MRERAKAIADIDGGWINPGSVIAEGYGPNVSDRIANAIAALPIKDLPDER